MPEQTEAAQSTKASEEFVEQVFSMPTLASQLPVKFPDGVAIHNLEVSCPVCETHSGCEDIRAAVVEAVNMATIKGYLCCQKCKNISPIHARMYPDGKVESQKDDTWNEAEFHPMSRLDAWFFQHIKNNPRAVKYLPPVLAAAAGALAGLWYFLAV